MRKALVVGGASGIGLAIATLLSAQSDVEKVYIVDRSDVDEKWMQSKFECYRFDLNEKDYSIFDRFKDIDTLMITAGFGKLALFKDLEESYIVENDILIYHCSLEAIENIAAVSEFCVD